MKKTRKYFAILLALVMTLTALPLSGLTASAATSGDFEYEVLSETDKTCEITDYTGEATELTIPSELDGYTVTSIGGSAFSWCESLTSVDIPNSVTSIGDSAFSWCESLTSVGFPNSVTSIGYNAFAYCRSLMNVDIPDSVTSIGGSAFADCTSLTNITVASGNSNYSSENGVLYNKEKTTLIQYPAGKTDVSYTIPDSVTSIGDSAFTDCTSLTSVDIPNSVTSIGDEAFISCRSLTSVNIPDSVTSIASYAFAHCSSLTNVNIPSSVTTIENSAFAYCESLTSVDIPDSVTSIWGDAFYLCTSLTSVDIPDSVTSIEEGAFAGCNSLTNITVAINNPNYSSENGVLFNKDKTTLIQYPAGKTDISYTIPDSVNNIGGFALSDCIFLTSITIPNNVTSIGDGAFSDCSALASITLPDSLVRIGSNAFYGTAYYNNTANWEDGVLYINHHLVDTDTIYDYNSVLISSVPSDYKIKEGTITIAEESFSDCSTLKRLTIPGSVQYVGRYAFYGCSSLTDLIVEDGVKFIGVSAFAFCENLENIRLPDSIENLENQAPDSWSGGVFVGTAYYNNAANWEDGVLYIGNIVYGADLADVIKFREGTVTLADRLYEAEKIYLPRSVKNIGSYSFFIYYDEEKEDYCSSTFYGYAGSFAETYAKAHGYDFVDITPVVKEELVDIGEGYPPELIESIYVDMQFITVAEALSAYVEYFKAKGIEKEAIMLDENGNIIEDTSILCSEGMAISSWDTNNNLYLCGVEPAEESSVTLGDVNGDGTIDAADAVMIQRYDSGLTTLTDEQLAAADVNADGLVDAADAVKIQRYDAGLIASL